MIMTDECYGKLLNVINVMNITTNDLINDMSNSFELLS